MSSNNQDLEAQLQAVLRGEAGELRPPTTLWPRVQAHLTRPLEGSPAPILMLSSAHLRRLRRGDRRDLALTLLAEREMDAFALIRRIEDVARAAGCPPPLEGTALPTLHNLERDGLVDARWCPGPRGLRRAYTLSARGHRMRRGNSAPAWLARLGSRLGRLAPRRVAQHG